MSLKPCDPSKTSSLKFFLTSKYLISVNNPSS